MVTSAPSKPNGIAVSDADKNIKIKWEKVFGPGALSFAPVDVANPIIAATATGQYLAKITAEDSSGNVAVGFLRIDWGKSDNVPPHIRMPKSLQISTPTNIPGVSVTDAGPIKLRWHQVSGPGTLLFSDPTVPMPVISATAGGAYIARLTATDAEGNQSTSDLALIWQVLDQSAPKLTMGKPLRISTPARPKGIAATDDDAALKFAWTQIAGPGSLRFDAQTDLMPLISASVPGVYVASLRAVDHAGNESIGILEVTWFDPDLTMPVIVMGGPLTIGKPTKLLQIQVTDNDPNLTLKWTKVSGPGGVVFETADQSNPSVSMTADGVYEVRLTVSDSAQNTTTGQLQIIWDRSPPTVYAGANRTVAGEFSIQDSTVADLSPVTMSWATISKPMLGSATINNAASLHPSIKVNYPGDYIFELAATDVNGLQSRSRLTVTVDVPTWVATKGKACSEVCRASGRSVAKSPEGAECTSGENVIASAVPWIAYPYGCWRTCAPTYQRNAASIGGFCYHSTQKRDNDRTDITTGCYCK